MRCSLALACLALAFACASASDVNISAIHDRLAAVDPSLAGVSAKVSVSGHYRDEEYEKYADKYGKYEDKSYGYGKNKYDKYEPEYKAKYEHEHKYEHEDKYYDYKAEYGRDYGHGESKLNIKLFEIKRGELRPQAFNPDTFQFSSTVSCKNPAEAKPIHAYDGLIDIPVDAEVAAVPVGVCEWTVHRVQPTIIGEHAEIEGSTNVVCTFTEEAERQCKGDFLCEGMSVSAQGLLYHFDQAPAEYGYAAKKPVAAYAPKYGYAPVEEPVAEEPAAVQLDVMLSLINGVNAGHKKAEYDNGVLQFFYAVGAEVAPGPVVPPTAPATPPADVEPVKIQRLVGHKAAVPADQADLVGQYTLVFKH